MTDRKLTQSEYCNTVGLSSSNFTRLRNFGDNNVTVENLCQVIHEYNISPIWLMTGTGDIYSITEKISASRILTKRVAEMDAASEDIRASIKILKKYVK